MADDNLKQPGVRVSESLWNEFREDIRDRRGGVRGHMRTELENALRSYLEASRGGDVTDRLRRIENKLDELEGEGGTPSGDGTSKTKKDSSVSSTVANRVEAIEEQIEREAAGAKKVHESVINAAIEDNAGSSRPTLDRYKEMLEQRHIAHEWPAGGSRTWWLDSELFVNVLDQNFPKQNNDFAEKYGREWWREQLDGVDDTPQGFQ